VSGEAPTAAASLKPAARRVRTPTILQMDALECGAASLGMVLAYHGRWVPLEELRQACGVTRDGSKASNVLKAARVYGLTAKGFKKEPEQLMTLPVPSIIHWNFNHYVVFEGIQGGRVHINDPAHGPKTFSLEEFGTSFTGVVLAFSPGADFRKDGRPPSTVADIARHLGHSRDGLVMVAAASLLLVLPGIVIPGLSKLFVDHVLVQQMDSWVKPLCLGLAAAALMQGALTWLQQRHLVKLQIKLSMTLSARYLGRLLELPIAFLNQRSRGELAGRVAGADRIAQMLSSEVATCLFSMASVVFYAIAMAAYDLLMAAVSVLLAGLNFAVLSVVQRRNTDLNRKLVGEQGKLLGATSSTIAAIETIKVSGRDDDVFSQWSGYQAQALTTQQELGALNGMLACVPSLLTALSGAAILALGGLRVIDGELSVGALVAIQALMMSFAAPIASLVGLGGRLQAARGDFERLADVLNTAPAPERGGTADEPYKLEGRVEFRDVSFGYSPCEEPLVRDLSLQVAPGSRVALVGASGSGKSTVGRLACGLYKPWSGDILIDGRSIADISAPTFANSVAYVDQDVFLFEGTVRENLTLWDAALPDAAVTQALKDACIHADVSARANGIDAHVAEGGSNFSGGQRQRLEIARALVGDPCVLVLDEATAALDPVAEKLIDENIRRRGCTCLIIAHRLSTIRDCDEIIVFRKGQVVERGKHDELVARGGAYSELIQAVR